MSHYEENCFPRRGRLDDALALLDPMSRQIIELWLEGTPSSDPIYVRPHYRKGRYVRGHYRASPGAR